MTNHHVSPEMALKLRDAGFPQPVLDTSTEKWGIHPQIGMMWYWQTDEGEWVFDTPMDSTTLDESPVTFARFGSWHESDDLELVYAPTATEIMAALPGLGTGFFSYKHGCLHTLFYGRFVGGGNAADVVAEQYLLQCQQTTE